MVVPGVPSYSQLREVPTAQADACRGHLRTTEAFRAAPRAGQGDGSLPVRTGRVSLPARWLAPIFSARTWLAMVYLVTGLPLGIISFVLALVGLVVGVVLLPLALLGLPVLLGTLLVSGAIAALERGELPSCWTSSSTSGSGRPRGASTAAERPCDLD